MPEAGSERECLIRALEGDERAQRDLYETYHGPAFRLAYLLLHHKLDVEEVVQDAFVYAFRNIGRYDPGRGSFWTWLRVILVSRCRNKRRRKRLRQVSWEVLVATCRAPADASPISDPAKALERVETRRLMWKALEQVSAGARDALVLRYYEGMAYAEIADALGCSSDAARSRVVHGKKQLRRLLTEPQTGLTRELGATRPAGAR